MPLPLGNPAGAHAVSVLQDVLRVAGLDNEASSKAVKECALGMMNAEKGDPSLKGLQPHPILEDLLGQVTEALESKQSWRRWGAHYLRNLISAHRSEACNNFKVRILGLVFHLHSTTTATHPDSGRKHKKRGGCSGFSCYRSNTS
jgi:hypothetical protein